jgi:translation elongation factor EF-Tu-like GTPase
MKYIAVVIVVLVLIAAISWLYAKLSAKTSAPIKMPIDDVFALKGGGKIVVVGVVEEGRIEPGQHLVVRAGTTTLAVVVVALEAFHKPLRIATKGDRVGVMLVGASKEQIAAGSVLSSN